MSATWACSTLRRVEQQLAVAVGRSTLTPCSSSRPETTSTSLISGTSRSRHGPSASRAATIALETRFLAPADLEVADQRDAAVHGEDVCHGASIAAQPTRPTPRGVPAPVVGAGVLVPCAWTGLLGRALGRGLLGRCRLLRGCGLLGGSPSWPVRPSSAALLVAVVFAGRGLLRRRPSWWRRFLAARPSWPAPPSWPRPPSWRRPSWPAPPSWPVRLLGGGRLLDDGLLRRRRLLGGRAFLAGAAFLRRGGLLGACRRRPSSPCRQRRGRRHAALGSERGFFTTSLNAEPARNFGTDGLLDLHGGAGARVAAGARGAGGLLERAEAGDGDAAALGDLADDHVQDGRQRSLAAFRLPRRLSSALISSALFTSSPPQGW